MLPYGAVLQWYLFGKLELLEDGGKVDDFGGHRQLLISGSLAMRFCFVKCA